MAEFVQRALVNMQITADYECPSIASGIRRSQARTCGPFRASSSQMSDLFNSDHSVTVRLWQILLDRSPAAEGIGLRSLANSRGPEHPSQVWRLKNLRWLFFATRSIRLVGAQCGVR